MRGMAITNPTSETPESDALRDKLNALKLVDGLEYGQQVLDFARSLETRLKAALADVERLKIELELECLKDHPMEYQAMDRMIVELNSKLTTLQQENAALKEVLGRLRTSNAIKGSGWEDDIDEAIKSQPPRE